MTKNCCSFQSCTRIIVVNKNLATFNISLKSAKILKGGMSFASDVLRKQIFYRVAFIEVFIHTSSKPAHYRW
ncbi:hypothetical protein BER93_05550 [Xanthomonas fragariae]|nr:hypothetical protein BER93_05550 [Xanthomonas fragariae]